MDQVMDQNVNANEPVNEPQAPQASEPDNEPKKAEKTFTQEELDRIVKERLERERKKYANYGEMQKELEELRKMREEIERQNMTELERYKADLEKAQKALKEKEKELSDFRTQYERDKIAAEFREKARAANIEYVDDALALADLSGVSIEDGKVVGIDEVIKKLVETKPFLVAKKATQKPIGEPTVNEPKADRTSEQLLKEAAEKAKRSGRLEDHLAFVKLKRKLGL